MITTVLFIFLATASSERSCWENARQRNLLPCFIHSLNRNTNNDANETFSCRADLAFHFSPYYHRWRLCRRKERCGILRHNICRDGVEVCSLFRREGTCGPCDSKLPPDRYLYWADSAFSGKIGRIHLTNSSEDNPVVDSIDCSGVIAIDSFTGDVFYGENGVIYRATADLDNAVPILGGYPSGLAVDNVRGKLYRTDSPDIQDSVFSSLQELLSGIAIDSVNHHLYPMACDPNNIYRCNTDGDCSDCTRLVTTSDCMYSIALDVPAGKLYMAGRSTTLFRANLDGTNLKPFVTGGNNIGGVAVSPSNGKVYWSDDTVIRMAPRSATDGSASVTDFITIAGYT